MNMSAKAFGLSTDFDAFLQAQIGDDEKGMQVSVLSALARLDLDPWKVAEGLSQLPKDVAIQQLDSLIKKVTASQWILNNSATIATRVVGLLPRSLRSTIPSHDTHTETRLKVIGRDVAIIILFFMLMSAVVASQVIDSLTPSDSYNKSPGPSTSIDADNGAPSHSGR